jgi:hypothetical protein
LKPDGIPSSLLNKLAPSEVQAYVKAKGWLRVPNRRPELAVFHREVNGEMEGLVIPQDPDLVDYAQAMNEAVRTLALIEGRTPGAVIDDLLLPAADVIRFRVISNAAEEGVLPLEDAVRLFGGVRKALLSSACTAVHPQSVHPRLSRSQAKEMVDACKLGVEKGSFVARVVCPLDAVESEERIEAPSPPFVRKATQSLLQGANEIVSALIAGDPDRLAQPEMAKYLSANLCEAILEMQPNQGDGSILEISASWAPILPAEAGVPQQVRLRREHFQAIERTINALRPLAPPQRAVYVGHVETLMGAPDADGNMAGEVSLRIVDDDELLRVRVNLNVEDYLIACDAHRDHLAVSSRGELRRGARVHRLLDYRDFRTLG